MEKLGSVVRSGLISVSRFSPHVTVDIAKNRGTLIASMSIPPPAAVDDEGLKSTRPVIGELVAVDCWHSSSDRVRDSV